MYQSSLGMFGGLMILFIIVAPTKAGPADEAALLAVLTSNNTSDDSKLAAIEGLRKIRPKSNNALTILSEMAHSRQTRLLRPALQCLATMGQPAISSMVTLLQDDDEEVRRLTCEALGAMKHEGEEAVPYLLAAVDWTQSAQKRKLKMPIGPYLVAIDYIKPDAERTSKKSVEWVKYCIEELPKKGIDHGTLEYLCRWSVSRLKGTQYESKVVVPLLVRILSLDQRYFHNLTRVTIQTLGSYGEDAKNAVLPLRTFLKSPSLGMEAEKAIAAINKAN